MKLYLRFSLIFLISFLNLILKGQTKKEDPKDLFLEAESYFLFEEYRDALPLYQKIYKNDPDNYHIAFKIGVCYLFDKYQKEKAITYLEKAITNTSDKFKEGNFKEKRAPLEAYYYLARAYHVNNKLDKAIEMYNYFLKILDPKIYDENLVRRQIKSCQIAKEFQSNPLFIKKENIGPRINTRYPEFNPIVSGDEKTIVFTRRLPFYDAVFYSVKKDDKWSEPLNLTEYFGLDGNSYCTGLSWEGDEIYVYRNDNYDGNIYVSYLRNGKWSKLEKLNDNINTKYWESHASISPDGLTLYFTSNRKGGYGGLDIYISKRSAKGKNDWGPATNLGPIINSEYNEDTPFITGDGKTLYFSSLGHYNMGGYDIFYSTLQEDGSWSKPLNAGYPINSTDDDYFFVPVGKGEYAYYALINEPDAYGMEDIFRFEIFSDIHPRKIKLKGLARIEPDLSVNYSTLMAKLLNPKTNEIIDQVKINKDGTFELDAPHGNLNLIIEGEGIKTQQEKINIPLTHPTDEYSITTNIHAIPRAPEISSPEKSYLPLLEIPYDTIYAEPFKIVKIPLRVEKNAKLKIQTFENDHLSNTELFDTKKENFTYNYKTQPGVNKIVFEITDKNNNTNKKELFIICPEPSPQLTFSIIPLLDSLKVKKNQDYIKDFSKSLNQSIYDLLLKALSDTTKNWTLSELYDYLVQNLNDNFTIDEINEMFLKFMSFKDPKIFYNETDFLAGDSVKNLIYNKLKIDKEIILPYLMLKYIYSNNNLTNNTLKEVDEFTLLMSKNNILKENDLLNALLNNLKLKINNDLYNILQDSLRKNPSYTTNKLRELLKKDNNKPEDLNNLLAEYASYYNVHFMHHNMLLFSENGIHEFLCEINLYKKNLNSSYELIKYVWTNADNKKYSNKDLLNLVENIQEDPLKGLRMFKEILSQKSTGDLHSLIENIDFKKNNIFTYTDLVKYLLNNSIYHDYTRSTIYNILTDILGVTNLQDFAKELERVGPETFSLALKKIDFSTTTNTNELIQELIGMADEYNYKEDDIINAIIRLICEKGLKNLTEKAEGFGFENYAIPGLAIISLILFFIILYLRKKRNEKKNKS